MLNTEGTPTRLQVTAMRALKVHVQLQVSIDGRLRRLSGGALLSSEPTALPTAQRRQARTSSRPQPREVTWTAAQLTVTASIAEAHAPLCEVVGTPLRISTVAGTPDLHARAETLERLCIHDRIPTACLPLCQAAKITLLTESTAGQL